ncbi:calmodulin-regulated spectrin-associated protein 1-B-like isoform X1 [Saccostrea echinata]|uniref:calmodulin-regulated spectrin-associated protein 1-B-like isoform X1 n=1 Tax=Saccostrea echinata TaxID=191078 RepID=UPI002A7F5E66|nr:calmodulin-regulated spectrin-associated protein 1-B-like isoform X1 [Saccostrea echinata]
MNQSVESTTGVDNDIIEIIPMEEYDSNKAKLQCSVSWILDKAFRDQIPKDLKDPFYETQDGALHVKPQLLNLMVSSEIYCQACNNMFGDSSLQWRGTSGHSTIIQVMSRKGIYVVDASDNAVTESVLIKSAPFDVGAHIALIDTLMLAYIRQTVTIEKAVQAVRKFATFNASSELPSSVEDALLFWINKVCVAVQLSINKEDNQVLEGETSQKVRIVSKSGMSMRESVNIPLIEDLSQDIGDGCSLAVLISFYCPSALSQQDICLKSNVGIADSLYNLRLVKEFCDNYIPGKVFHLTYEDFLYMHNNLRGNVEVFLAELFYWFELQKLDCVQDESGSRPTTAKKLTSNAIPNLPPISNVTKQSFHKTSMDDAGFPRNVTQVAPRQPLLHKRQQESGHEPGVSHKGHGTGLPRPKSAVTVSDRNVVHQSVLAWQEDSQQSDVMQQSGGSNLLANVSIDSELMESFTDDQLGSLDMDLSDTPPPTLPSNEEARNLASNLHDPSHPDYMEVQSVTSGTVTNRTIHQEEEVRPDSEASLPQKPPNHQDLLNEFSAQVDPKVNRQSKDQQYEPLLPAKLKPCKEAINNHSKEQERGEQSLFSKSVKSREMDVGSSSVLSDSSSSVPVTPLPEDQLSDQDVPKQPRYAAFTVNAELSQDMESPRRSVLSTARSQGGTADSVKGSYTVSNEATSESARAAGIPVVGESGEQSWRRWGSREGSVASSRSSGDNSDHESHKIHYDQKGSENKDKIREVSPPKSLTRFGSKENTVFQKPKMIVRSKTTISPKKETSKHMTTNFAEIKRMKNVHGNVDNSGMVYMQHGHEVNNKVMQGSTTQINNRNIQNTTSPSRTTWQHTSTVKSPDETTSDSSENSDNRPVLSELTEIRLKLEEKRKQIERKKNRMEIQQQKQRQKLGKTAFLHVVAKPTEEEEVSDGHSSHGSEASLPGSEEALSSTSDKDRRTSLTDGKTSGTPQGNRAFSREGIQQTIENVRKKWFQDEKDERIPRSEVKVEETVNRRESSPQNGEIGAFAVPARRETLPPKQQIPVEQNISKPDKKTTKTSELDDSSVYNQKLEKLDHDLNDLKGEILRMSLEQEQFNGNPVVTSIASRPSAAQSRYAMDTPERKLQGKAFQTPDLASSKDVDINTPERLQYGTPVVCRPAGYTCPIDPSLPTPERAVMGGGVAQYPQGLPPQMPVTQPFQPQVLPQSSPYTGQSQFSPMRHTHVPYSGLHTHSTMPFPQPQFPLTPPQVYQQSPPYAVNPNLVSPHGHYGMQGIYNMTSQQFPLHSHITSSSPAHPPVSYMNSPNHTGAQVFQPNVDNNTIPPVLSVSQADKPATSSAFNDSGLSNKVETPDMQNVSVYDGSQNKSDLQSDTSADQNGFFVSFGSESPKTKPKLSSAKTQRAVTPEPASQQNQTQQSPPMNQSSQSANLDMSVTPGNTSVNSQMDTSQHDSSGIGFVVGEGQENLTKSMEEELNRKKEKFIQMQIKRKEEQDKKRQYKELEMARRKEQERIKQEEAERRKASEKARREEIFRQYQDKKHQEEDDYAPPVRRNRSKTREKQRPKSMFVKGDPQSGSVEGLLSNSSQEDLSSQAFTISPGHTGSSGVGPRKPPSLAPRPGKIRKAASCNTLTSSTEGRLTYRRPPSPDLGRLKGKGRGSTESSESGSDYAGPKLFVKPSSKSNRHIIINAISQCVLAGPVNADQKNKVLEVLAKSDAKHFLILFRDHSCQFRGLYSFDPDTEDSLKIHGIGPKQITSKMIERFYKYNSGGKSFSEVTSTKHLSVSIDAIVIHNALWKTSSKPPHKK